MVSGNWEAAACSEEALGKLWGGGFGEALGKLWRSSEKLSGALGSSREVLGSSEGASEKFWEALCKLWGRSREALGSLGEALRKL